MQIETPRKTAGVRVKDRLQNSEVTDFVYGRDIQSGFPGPPLGDSQGQTTQIKMQERGTSLQRNTSSLLEAGAASLRLHPSSGTLLPDFHIKI